MPWVFSKESLLWLAQSEMSPSLMWALGIFLLAVPRCPLPILLKFHPAYADVVFSTDSRVLLFRLIVLFACVTSFGTLPHKFQVPPPSWILTLSSQPSLISPLWIQKAKMIIGLSNFIPFSQRSQSHFSCFHCLKTIFSCILSNFLIVYSRRPSLVPVIPTCQKPNNFTLIVF